MHKLIDFTHKTVPGVTDGGSQYRGQFAVYSEATHSKHLTLISNEPTQT